MAEFSQGDLDDIREAQKEFQEEMSRSLSSFLGNLNKEAKIRKDVLNLEKELLKVVKNIEQVENGEIKLTKEQLELLKKKRDEYATIVSKSRLMVSSLEKSKALYKAIGNEVKGIADSFSKGLLTYLNEADKTLKDVQQNLGIFGAIGDQFIDSINKASVYSASLGVTNKDLATFQKDYANQMGVTAILTEDQLKSLARVQAGTGFAAESIGEMTTQYANAGGALSNVESLVQNISNDAKQMGLSSGKLIKDVFQNMDKINKFGLQGGVKALMKMSEYSQKMRINMDGVFSASEKARTLEGALDMASNLMVLGGQFSKADPFKLAFLAREKPEEFTKELVKMSGAVAKFNKQTKEFDIGAYDFDRLKQAAEASGRNVADLMQEAKTLAEIEAKNKQIFIGNKKQKDLITSMSTLGANGGYEIKIDGAVKKLGELQTKDIVLLEKEQKSLEESAKLSMTFDKTFTTFIESMKATMLPLLNVANSVLQSIQKLMGAVPDWGKTLLSAGLVLTSATVALLPLLASARMLFTSFKGSSSIADSVKGAIGGKVGNTVSGGSGGGIQNIDKATTTSSAGTAANYSRAASIAAIGIAAVGIGYGIKLASEGFAELGKVIKDLNPEQQNTLMGSMAITMGGFAVALGIIGVIGQTTAAGLGTVALATMGIGFAMVEAGYGMKLFSDAYTAITNPDLKIVEAVKGMDFQPMKDAFREANNFIQADFSKLDKLKKAISDIGELKISGVDRLEKLLSKPLEMRFASDQKAVINIELNNIIDNDKYINKIAKEVSVKYSNAKRGNGSI